MASGVTADALKQGIGMEYQTRSFYLRVEGKVKDRRARRRLGRMARDEEGHAASLKGRLKRLCGEEFDPDPSAPPDPRFGVAEAAVYDQAIAREIVSVGILIENESIKHYSGLRDATDDRADRRLYSDLVRFEEGHKARLQREYRRLDRGVSW